MKKKVEFCLVGVVYLTYNQPHPKNILIGLKNHNGTSSLASRTCREQLVLETKWRPNRWWETEKGEENNEKTVKVEG